MRRTKTEGLTFPADPLAAIRELQDLDAQAPSPRSPVPADSSSPTPASDDTEDDNITSNIPAHITTQEAANEDTQQPSQISAQEVAQPPALEGSHADAQMRSQFPARKSAKETAQQHAHRLGQTPSIPITLRLPEALNDWLDDLAHEHRKSKIKKQDLVALAMQVLLIAVEEGADVGAMLRGEFSAWEGER